MAGTLPESGAPVPCSEMWGGVCAKHATTEPVDMLAKSLSSDRTKLRADSIIAYDDRRKTGSAAATEAVQEAAKDVGKLRPLLFDAVPAAKWPLKEIEEILLSDEQDDVRVSKLVALCPIPRHADFAQPASLRAPLLIDVMELLRTVIALPDLFEQHSFKTGRRNAHPLKTMRRSPCWFQMAKKSGHPLPRRSSWPKSTSMPPQASSASTSHTASSTNSLP